MTLDKHLSSVYELHVLMGISKEVATQKLKAAICESDELKQQATDRLAELSAFAKKAGGQLENRCYLSHIYKLALEEALP